ARLQVGTVVTDQLLENVLAIGYNGNARGLPNKCDSAVPGNCGCIHSEVNALVKAPGSARDKVVFVSASPCVMCAKLIINSGAARPDAETMLDRAPSWSGTRVGTPGVIQFTFVHRFYVSPSPSYRVAHFPTCTFATGLPAHLGLGRRYSTRSETPGHINEFEL